MGNRQSAQDIPRMRIRSRGALPEESKGYLGRTQIVLLVIFAVLIIGAVIYAVFFPAKATSVTKRGPYELLGPSQVFACADNTKLMINDSDEAMQFFVYLDGNIRIGQSVDGGSNGPSNDSGLYSLCPCADGLSCNSCVTPDKSHKGYQTIINIQDTFVLEALNIPDASRPNAVSAQIYIKTQTNNPEAYSIETFPLPPLPEQKWTMITISKNGRQINVYYNSTLVLAKKTQKNFSYKQAAGVSSVSVGSKKLSGKVAMVTYFSSHQTISDVTARYGEQTDTRGNLNTMNVVPTSNSYTIVDSQQSSFIKKLCLDLSCFNPGPNKQSLPVIPSVYSSLDTQYA